MRTAAVIGTLLGLALSRMAFLMFDVPAKNCSEVCPVDPGFWPWAAVGAAVGLATAVLLTSWGGHLRRLAE